MRKLRYYDHNKDWYLGKPSIPEPLEIMDREHNNVSILSKVIVVDNTTFVDVVKSRVYDSLFRLGPIYTHIWSSLLDDVMPWI